MAKGKKRSMRRGRRSRFRTARDAQQQLEQIEGAQKAAREGNLPLLIDSIEKSRQRFRNRLREIKNAKDALEQFE